MATFRSISPTLTRERCRRSNPGFGGDEHKISVRKVGVFPSQPERHFGDWTELPLVRLRDHHARIVQQPAFPVAAIALHHSLERAETTLIPAIMARLHEDGIRIPIVVDDDVVHSFGPVNARTGRDQPRSPASVCETLAMPTQS